LINHTFLIFGITHPGKGEAKKGRISGVSVIASPLPVAVSLHQVACLKFGADIKLRHVLNWSLRTYAAGKAIFPAGYCACSSC
jgi:hypothetical protein